jgi:hypothetical protein
MKHSNIFVVMMTAVILMVALSGCTSNTSPPPKQAENVPLVTYTAAMTPLETAVPATAAPTPDTVAMADKDFVDAFTACYAASPVITNITTNNAFVNCLDRMPNPKGLCAVDFKNNVYRFTKADDTTAGYNSANRRIRLAMDAYKEGMSYDFVTEQNVACGLQPKGFPLI